MAHFRILFLNAVSVKRFVWWSWYNRIWQLLKSVSVWEF